MSEARVDPVENLDSSHKENDQGEKRKRAVEEINFESIQNDDVPENLEEENEEPPSKKSKVVEEKTFMPESNLPLFPAQCCLHTLLVYWPEETKSVLGDQKPEEITDAKLVNELISRIKYIKGIKTGTKINDWVASIGLHVVEEVVCEFTPVDITGFSNAQYDPDFQALWQEISIDLMTFQYLDPKKRMLLYLLKNAYLLNAMNKSGKKLPKVVEIPVEKE